MSLSRRLLAKVFPGEPRLVEEFRTLSDTVDEASTTASDTAQATSALQDATVLTLSANDTLTNERILKLAPGLKATDDGTYLTVRLDSSVARVKENTVTFLPLDDASLFVEDHGTIMVRQRPIIDPVSAADDTAAATAGVPVGGLYHTSGTVKVRLA